MAKQITTSADAVHWLALDPDSDEPRLTLICTAVKGAECRMRPTNADELDSWRVGDPDLTFVDADCWAVEWVRDAGFEDACRFGGATLPERFGRIPVEVAYDEGVELIPIEPHPVLPALALCDRLDAAEAKLTAAKATLSPHSTEAHGCTCTECRIFRILEGDPDA